MLTAAFTLLFATSTAAFSLHRRSPLLHRKSPIIKASLAQDTQATASVSRRDALGAALASGISLSTRSSSAAIAADKAKVVVVGTGLVGSYVVQQLAKEGVAVVAVARSSPSEQADKVKKLLGTNPSGVEYVSIDASTGDLSGVLAGASACISCVGVIPGSKDQLAGNGAVNVRIADAAKAAGVGRFVYVSVGSAISGGPGKFIFGDYMKGKAQAEAAVSKDYGKTNALIVRPNVISGGPPGGLPGPPGVPAVPVQAVAAAAVAGALGKQSGVLDGAEEIIAGGSSS